LTDQPRNQRGRFTFGPGTPEANKAINADIRRAAGYGPDTEPAPAAEGSMNKALYRSGGVQNQPPRLVRQSTSLAARQRSVAARIFRKPTTGVQGSCPELPRTEESK
jgi:hypothetical protein